MERQANSYNLNMPSDAQKHYVHHSYIWLGTIRISFYVLLVAVLSSFGSLAQLVAKASSASEITFAFNIGLLIVVAFFILVVVVVLLFQWWSYKHLYYVLGADEFNLYSGIFNKKRVHIPYAKVQSIDQKASLIQRIAGVRSLYIDTAGGANNKAIVVPYITKHDAEWLRSELFTRKAHAMGASAPVSSRVQGNAGSQAQTGKTAQDNILDIGQQVWDELPGVFAGESFEDVPVQYEYGLSNGELALAGLSNNTSFATILIGIFVVLSQIIDLIFDLSPSSNGDVLNSMIDDFSMQFIQFGVFAIVGLVIFIVVVIWIISVIGTCIGYGGFKARRRGSRIEVEYGLLQHTVQGVDIDRVQAVVVSQTFIRKIFGYCQITLSKVDAYVNNNDAKQSRNKQGVVLHPFVKISKVPEIIAGIIPEYDNVDFEAYKLAPVALRRALIRRCIVQSIGFWLAVAVAIFQVAMSLSISAGITHVYAIEGSVVLNVQDITTYICAVGYLIAAIIIVVSAISAVMWARSSCFGINARFMQVTNNGLSTETVRFPRQKIQFGYSKTNPLQRAAHTATINAVTAAGVGGTTVKLIDVSQEDAEAWLTWLEPRR